MEKVEIILDNYSQETRNTALVAALKSGNSTLVELVLKLKPDIRAGGEALFKYAITNCDFELLGKLLWEPEIGNNQELLNEGIRIAISLRRTEWYEILSTLIQDGGNPNVAVEELLKQDNPSTEAIIALLKLGAKAHFWPMHLDKHQLIVEKLFKEGFGKSVKFSNVALEQFCVTICKNDKQGVVKKLIKDCPDLVETLTQIAVKGGYTKIVKLLYQENAITTIDDELFEEAIYKKRYLTVKYLVKSGIREVKFTDVITATAFCNLKITFFLIEQFKLQGNVMDSVKHKVLVEIACISDRKDIVTALLEEGYDCEFDANIKKAATYGYMKLVNILLQYGTKLSSTSFDEAIKLATMNGHTETANRMQAYKRNNPHKFN